MLSRAVFILIALFWLAMNVLLWREEFGARATGASTVPVDLVWEKVLTSPDSSSLSVLRKGMRVGFFHCITGVGEDWASVGEENLPNGPPAQARSYRLRLDGSFLVPELTNRVRLSGWLKVDGNRAWQELDAQLDIRSATWQIHSVAAEKTLKLTTLNGDTRFEHLFRFSDLQNPGALLGEFIGPYAEWIDTPEWPPRSQNAVAPAIEVKWEAREDTLWIGHRQVRVYRVQTVLLDRYRISLVINRVGEILRVELPGELVLVNDQLDIL